jgi:signal transduction histidine kinase
MDTSRRAGMAEVAAGVLHNVGNALNSVNVSATLVLESLQKSKVGSLAKAVELLAEHGEDAGEFLARDPKGQRLPGFLAKLSNQLTHDRAELVMEMEALKNNLDHIKHIVAMQRSFTGVAGALEPLAVSELVEEALGALSTALAQQQIEVAREFESAPPVLADRHKVLHILACLFTNAVEALGARAEGRRLVLRISCEQAGRPACVRFEVADNGAGIAPENLTRIFNQEFTMRKNREGFGLHASANAAGEMKGSLTARSKGPGRGATFTLELPVAAEKGVTKAA